MFSFFSFDEIYQVSSRIFLLWFIHDAVPQARIHWAFALMALSWSAVEVWRVEYMMPASIRTNEGEFVFNNVSISLLDGWNRSHATYSSLWSC